MSHQHHTTKHRHCLHCLHVCEPCDSAYCCKCPKQWQNCHQYHNYNWYVTSPTIYGMTTASGTYTIANTTTCEHGHDDDDNKLGVH